MLKGDGTELKLTDIGFIWDELKYKWEKNYNKLLDLMLQNQQQFKDLDLSKNEKLHSWIRTQRSGKKDNTIQNWLQNNKTKAKKNNTDLTLQMFELNTHLILKNCLHRKE